MNKKILCLLLLVLPLGIYAEDLADTLLAKMGIIVTQELESYYRTSDPIFRQEALGIMMKMRGEDKNSEECQGQYSDVSATVPNDWICPLAERARYKTLIAANPIFRPEESITFSETVGLMMKGVCMNKNFSESDLPAFTGETWQREVAATMYNEKILDLGEMMGPNDIVTREKVFLIGNRLLDWSFENDGCGIKAGSINIIESPHHIDGIDVQEIHNTWLEWVNEARAEQGLAPYTYHWKLDASSLEWSQLANARGYIDHRRSEGDQYYDYWKIDAWFRARGVNAQNISGVTHTENIGYGPYTCDDTECTQELLVAIKSTFDFYMSEKGTDNTAHYDSIMNPHFTKIGLGISIDESKRRYYLTSHYATQLLD